jgi:hypothetical protein
MIWAAIALGRIAVTGPGDFGLQLLRTLNGSIEVVKLKPEQHAVSVWPEFRVSDGTVVMLHVPSVQLQNETIARDQSFVLGAAMRTLTAKETLIPATARFDVTHANEWLWTHLHVFLMKPK